MRSHDRYLEQSMTLTDWIDSVVQGAVDTATCCAARDPLEILDEIEHDIIENFGINLNGKEIA
jgi:hypothetical protein